MKNVINGWFKKKKPQPHQKTLKSNLRYFKIDFTDAAHTDINKKKLADRCTEMLCLKEDCFEEEMIGKNFKIFKNKSKKYFGIVNGITGIEPIIQKIKKINTEMTVYILSYDGGNKIEEFEQVEKLVNLEPIPDDILNTFEQSYKAAYK
jgi:adenine-specific DNA-methyltransferase